MDDTSEASLRAVAGMVVDGQRVAAQGGGPIDPGTVTWPSPPAEARPLPPGWSATRVGDLRVGLPPGVVEVFTTSDASGASGTYRRPSHDLVSTPVVVVRSVTTPPVPFVAEANQLAARFTDELGVAPGVLHPVAVPRAPRAVAGTWRWSREGTETLSTVALVEGTGGERWTVQLNGAAVHLDDALVDAFHGALSVGLLNTAW